MKRLFLLASLLVLTSVMLARPVGQQKALQVGERFLMTTTLGQQRSSIDLQLVYTSATREAVDYYVFNVRGEQGFVIVAGDDRVKPILAYATSGAYNPEDVAEGFAYKLATFTEEIHYIREHQLAATPDIVAEWKAVMANGQIGQGRNARAVVGPLCLTTWNQNYPYSSQCPEDEEGSGGHVYAGCVATAMGQVMKYFDYPERGSGSHTYYPEGYTQQTANFGETDYHFELMPLDIDSTSTEEEYFYIAQFLHHCGIAVDMQYSGHGSGAYSMDVPPALRNYFGYTCDDDVVLGYWGWNFYTNEQWAQMLKDGGLDEQLPLYYSGADDNGAGGHAFVCDGYDENDYFHYNWGWSGRDDAWCPIGALNTTKYAFNDQNSFIGHILPQNSTYYQRADSVADFSVVENARFDGVLLSWTNPTLNLNGGELTSINSITIRRDNQVIATLDNVQAGAQMTYEDNDLEPGLYKYSISVTNEAGVSRNVHRTILVGEKCEVIFVLHDDAGNGWKGAAISVTDENGQRIAIITMDEGSEQTITLPLLKQNLNFIWNHGWYHNTEEYDTDYECSFSIMDAQGYELYASAELEDGIFMTYDNNCEFGPLTCYPVQNLQGEYQWHENDDFGAYISWDKPDVTSGLDHFRIIRTTGAYKDEELIAEIPYQGQSSFEYFDNTYGVINQDDVYYSVNCIFIRGEEQCESEYREVLISITDLKEQEEKLNIYPNPTKGLVNIESAGTMQIMVSNMLGQKVLEAEAEGNCSIDLSRFGQGIYLLRVETSKGSLLRKIVVK